MRLLISCFLTIFFLEKTSAISYDWDRKEVPEEPSVFDNDHVSGDDLDRNKRGDYKLVKIELEKYKPKKPCFQHLENPHMNIEIKKALDLKKLPKSSSSELIEKFHSLMDHLYSLKTDEDCDNKHKGTYENPPYEKPVPLPYSHYHTDDYYHRNYPPPPSYQYQEPQRYDNYYQPTTTTTTTTTTRPLYETTTKSSYKSVDYNSRVDPYYEQDRSYSYVKSDYETKDYTTTTTTKRPTTTTTTKKPYYPPPTTTTKRPYEEYRPDEYQPAQRYSFEVSYDDYNRNYNYYPEERYEKPKEYYSPKQEYRPTEPPKVYRPTEPPKAYVTTEKPYTTPYPAYNAVKSEMSYNDRPKSSYPEPYYDFVKYLEKDYPQQYFPDMAENYYKTVPVVKKIPLYPCKDNEHDLGPYELPVLYNPNRYDSLKRKDSPVHDNTALLKNFAQKDFYLPPETLYGDSDRDLYGSPYECKDADCKRVYKDESSYFLTKRKTAVNEEGQLGEEGGVKKDVVPDWEQSKAIAGSGELYGQVVKSENKPEITESTSEILTRDQNSEFPEEYPEYSQKKKEYNKIIAQIWEEMDKIQKELYRRKQQDGLAQNEMMDAQINDIKDFSPETVVTTDEDIKARYARDSTKNKAAFKEKLSSLFNPKNNQEKTKTRQGLFSRGPPEFSKLFKKN